jgi:hypothetical protein
MHFHPGRPLTFVAFAAPAAAALLLAIPAVTSAAPLYPSAAPAASSVPRYGQVGQGVWQVASIVNVGEPSLRIVYDQTLPGAYQSAMAAVYGVQSAFPTLSQPGTTGGLREIGYSAQVNGVQVQLYGTGSFVDGAWSQALTDHGLPLIPCTPAVEGCPAA